MLLVRHRYTFVDNGKQLGIHKRLPWFRINVLEDDDYVRILDSSETIFGLESFGIARNKKQK